MFSVPRYVIKSGHVVIDNHEFREDYYGRILHIAPEYDSRIVDSVRPFFENYYSIEFDNYAVGDSYLHEHEIISMLNVGAR